MVEFPVRQPAPPATVTFPPRISPAVGNDRIPLDPALQPTKPLAVPPPVGKIATSWKTQQDQNGAMVTGKLFGLDGPFEYEGHGTDVTDGSDTGPSGISLKPDTDTTTSAAAIIRREEGFNNAAWDVNAYRGGYGSDTVTKKDGSVVKVTKGMVIDKGDAERDVQRRIPLLNAQASRQIGPAYDKLPGPTKGVLIATVDNYGHVPAAVVAAARSGDNDRLANAVEALGADNGGIRRSRYKRGANIIRGIGLQSA